MRAVYANVHKKQRVELYIKPKRNWEEINPQKDHISYKRPKIKEKKRLKRKICTDLREFIKKSCKRLKRESHHCLIHEEKYICNIYECSGVYTYQQPDFMPYVI